MTKYFNTRCDYDIFTHLLNTCNYYSGSEACGYTTKSSYAHFFRIYNYVPIIRPCDILGYTYKYEVKQTYNIFFREQVVANIKWPSLIKTMHNTSHCIIEFSHFNTRQMTVSY